MLWQSFVSFLFLLTFIAANGSSNVDDIKLSDHILTTELLTNLTHYLELNTQYYTTLDAKLLKFVEQFKKAIDESIKELDDDDDDKEVEVQKPEACADINNSTGVYQLYLEDFIEKPFFVYCQKDSEDESAWTVIQRREDGSINFNRDWADYKRGFGNIYGE
ncbi:angiopoietin-4-like, partial [Teleopsis dalmanni]|uniref:angiopoietin-4-like n=1 Tax=Teleopsis dalmanni TaxID=139649 RepID=UPI0018CDB6ED